MKYFIVRNGLCLKDELDIAWAEGDWLTGGWEREGSGPRFNTVPKIVAKIVLKILPKNPLKSYIKSAKIANLDMSQKLMTILGTIFGIVLNRRIVPQKVCTGARWAGAIHSLCRVITQVYTLQNVCKDFTDTSSKQQTE